MLKAKGAEVVYTNNVDAANPDLKPELLRMQSAGAQAIMPWSVNAGFLVAHLQHGGAMGWTCRFVGQRRSLRPDPGLLEKPSTGTRSIRTTSAKSATRRQLPPAPRSSSIG